MAVRPDGFPLLQRRLPDVIDRMSSDRATVVVVPSLTLQSHELEKIPGAVHFEQRLLFELRLLRGESTNVVHVTSRPIDPAIIDYTLGLVRAPAGARERLTLLDCADGSATPLTEKVLRKAALLRRISAAIPDPARAYLVVFNATPMERELAERLGIPLFACDPDLSALGTKSGGRELLKAAGVPVPPGFENLTREDELVGALADLKAANPGVRKAVVKLNESFAGGGNAVFSYAGCPETGTGRWIAERVEEQLKAPGDTWPRYLASFERMGGVVECFVEARTPRSPSAQLELHPHGRVRVLSTHDQVLGGAAGQTFTGCEFPAREGYRHRVQELAALAGRELARAGVIGQLSIDFVVDEEAPDDPRALEINLRMGGATAPYMFMDALVGGHYDTDTGRYLAPDGTARHYVTSDRIQEDAFRFLSYDDLTSIADATGLAYDATTSTGAFYYALGSLSELGRFGLSAIGKSPADAQHRYHTLLNTLRETATTRAHPTGVPVG